MRLCIVHLAGHLENLPAARLEMMVLLYIHVHIYTLVHGCAALMLIYYIIETQICRAACMKLYICKSPCSMTGEIFSSGTSAGD